MVGNFLKIWNIKYMSIKMLRVYCIPTALEQNYLIYFSFISNENHGGKYWFSRGR